MSDAPESILIVDDEQSITDFVSYSLKKEGFSVDPAFVLDADGLCAGALLACTNHATQTIRSKMGDSIGNPASTKAHCTFSSNHV